MGGRYGAMYETWLSHTLVDDRTALPDAAR